ncbi:DUF423 domain-containing protein [Cellulophaga sp. E16_2]|uniref:DUF423 domain-containing protein n=1 Tax=Cellulophaga algicola (strain DSM 14237 / IC166 / ACAM 630) TaxID=688270 RepID=E6X544_CELAD|nr:MULTISPECIES: DUF423 domain-containing protein [Cellulophaga]ADV48355.1 protein of unknown function DUF423 [Cellulophaga algicola DSM 14237]MBO0590776.1 DUF423 domain-containing protein [Cellulophaga sp. E16_2]
MNKTIFTTGILFGTLAVVLGAFGAHGLKNLISVEAVASYNTGVTYQMYHALLLLILSGVSKIQEKDKKLIYWMFTIGIIFFSFSIYLLATNSLFSFNFKSIALLTPIGGMLLIVGWVLLGFRYYKENY